MPPVRFCGLGPTTLRPWTGFKWSQSIVLVPSRFVVITWSCLAGIWSKVGVRIFRILIWRLWFGSLYCNYYLSWQRTQICSLFIFAEVIFGITSDWWTPIMVNLRANSTGIQCANTKRFKWLEVHPILVSTFFWKKGPKQSRIMI
jgi:hypothetical protein